MDYMEVSNFYLDEDTIITLCIHLYSLPLKGKNMAEDRKENEMMVVNSVDYLRGLQGKDSVLLNPSNLLSDTFKRRSVFEGDANTLITPGMYYINGKTTNVPFGYSGLMIVFTFDDASVQMVFNVFSGIGKRRARLYNNGAWNIWSAWD